MHGANPIGFGFRVLHSKRSIALEAVMAFANQCKQFPASPSHRASFNSHGVLTTPDGSVTFVSSTGKAKAAIQFALLDNGFHAAEFRFRFLCGRFEGSTLPISTHSKVFKTKSEAIADAAARLLADLRSKCGDGSTLQKSQQPEYAALVAWATNLSVQTENAQPLAGLKFVDLFAGIGGFHTALKQHGAECVAAVERDKHAVLTYRANHGDKFPLFGDIRQVDAHALPDFDILCGGFPCQSFSIAGNQEGYDHPEKGGLFFEAMRIARIKQPAIIILENVSAFASHDDGKTADQALDAFSALGYASSMRVMTAADFGLPQQRERLFIVAHRLDFIHSANRPFAFPDATDTTRTVADILEKGIRAECCNGKVNPLPAKVIDSSRPNMVGLIGKKNMQGYRVYSAQGKGITLCACSGGPGRQTGLYLIDGNPRRLTPRECARMQGFPDSFIPNPSPAQACKQFGNAVAVPLVAEIAKTARTFI
jgi:DNA (cytosine-5)-methyltransferase 1